MRGKLSTLSSLQTNLTCDRLRMSIVKGETAGRALTQGILRKENWVTICLWSHTLGELYYCDYTSYSASNSEIQKQSIMLHYHMFSKQVQR